MIFAFAIGPPRAAPACRPMFALTARICEGHNVCAESLSGAFPTHRPATAGFDDCFVECPRRIIIQRTR